MLVSKPLHRFWLTVLAIASLFFQSALLPNLANAQDNPSGQLISSKSVSVNGAEATAGQTVFSGSKILVGDQGLGIVNLSSLGRVEIGSNTEYILQTSGKSIAGELIVGCMQIIASAGTPVNIETAYGNITTNGRQGATLTIGIKGGLLHVISDQGDVTITSGGKTAMVTAGQYVSVSNRGGVPTFSAPKSAPECGQNGGVSCTCRTAGLANKGTKSQTGKSSGKGGGKGGGPVGGIGTAGVAIGILGAAGSAAAVGVATRSVDTGLTCVGTNCTRTSPTNPNQ